jgi:CDP-diacylglycerol--glycerol-3-phosphate 3-phosphatidyltransferase
MANLITLARLLLLFVVVALAYWAPPQVQLGNAALILFVIALDGVDGYVARKRGESSTFGSIFDIAVDRAVENVMWIVLGDLGLVPIWVAIVFIVRGAIVDTVRYARVGVVGNSFGVSTSRIGRWLVSGRTMRGAYGAAKALTFAVALLSQPLPSVAPGLWATSGAVLQTVTLTLVALSVALCLLRGLPVVAEFVRAERVFTLKRPVLASG